MEFTSCATIFVGVQERKKERYVLPLKQPDWPMRTDQILHLNNAIKFWEQKTKINKTRYEWPKNLIIYTCKILNSGRLRFLPLKDVQHGLIQDGEFSKLREGPMVEEIMAFICQWQGWWDHGPKRATICMHLSASMYYIWSMFLLNSLVHGSNSGTKFLCQKVLISTIFLNTIKDFSHMFVVQAREISLFAKGLVVTDKT